MAETLYEEGYLTNYECASLETIGNSIETYLKLGVMGSQTLLKGNGEAELVLFIKQDQKINALLKSVYERLTFFKPRVTFNFGIIKFEEDVKKIVTSSF